VTVSELGNISLSAAAQVLDHSSDLLTLVRRAGAWFQAGFANNG
jgi:hypothetical protein